MQTVGLLSVLLRVSNSLKACSAGCSQSTECLISHLLSALFSGCVELATAVASDLIPVETDGKWQCSAGTF